MRARALVFVSLLFAAMSAGAQSAPVDVTQSKLTIHAFKAGLFSGFAHDHQIAAPVSRGTIDQSALYVQLRFVTQSLKVLDPKASPSDRAQIQQTMLSEKVLDAARFPEIAFTSQRVAPGKNGGYSVEGELILHGVRRPLTIPVALENGRYIGSVKLKQTDFGITPIKLFGGTVKVKDEIQITFDIVPARSAQAQ